MFREKLNNRFKKEVAKSWGQDLPKAGRFLLAGFCQLSSVFSTAFPIGKIHLLGRLYLPLVYLTCSNR